MDHMRVGPVRGDGTAGQCFYLRKVSVVRGTCSRGPVPLAVDPRLPQGARLLRRRRPSTRECAPHDAPGSDDFLATDDCQRRTAQRGPDDGNDDHDNDDRCAAGPEKEPFGLSPGLFKKFVRDVWGWLFGW